MGTTWRFLADRVPEGIEQVVVRRPEYGVRGAGGAAGFRGWKWECPGCKKSCRTLFYPLAAVLRPELSMKGLELPGAWEMESPPRPGCFACKGCHGVTYYSRLDGNAWNELVAHLSGGLLYGSEVERPGWFDAQKKRRRREEKRKGKPAKKREEVRGLLLGSEKTMREIGVELGMSEAAVKTLAHEVYKREGVHRRGELREKVAGEDEGGRMKDEPEGARALRIDECGMGARGEGAEDGRGEGEILHSAEYRCVQDDRRARGSGEADGARGLAGGTQ